MLTLSLISSLIVGLANAPTVTFEHPIGQTTSTFDKVVQICRTDVSQYIKGDTTYLERGIKDFDPDKQQYMMEMCTIYAIGVTDGLRMKTYKDTK